MKHLFLFFTTITLVFTSCSSDDDASPKDQIIGTWTLHKSYENDVEYTLDTCERLENIVIDEVGRVDWTFYYDNDGTCEFDGKELAEWENLGDGVYRFTYDVDEDEKEYVEEHGGVYEVGYDDFKIEDDTLIWEHGDEDYPDKEIYIKN